MKKSGTARVAGAAALALGLSVAMGLSAQAASTASTHGTCSGTSTYKLVASGHKDSIVVKAKVATDVSGEAWTFSIADNGNTVVSGDGTTNSAGKLIVRESIPNLDGADTIGFTATDTVTGETCTAEVVF